MDRLSEILPHWNATLNLVALLLLWTGRRMIRQGREVAHRRVMLGAFATSTVFLASYLLYHHVLGGGRRFHDYPPAAIRNAYLAMLASHVVLAAGVPFLAVAAIWLGWRDRRAAHRRLVRWAYPIWVYVSLTGVLVYLTLYQIYPPVENPAALSATRPGERPLAAASEFQ
jgi:uncharacterized membrane protein YozB (DUF420 family)